MREQLLNFLAPREEKITLAGVDLTVREVSAETDVSAFVDGVDMVYKWIVRSVLDADGMPAFTDADIPALKAAGKMRLAELSRAVGRVNGWQLDDEVKNSAAVPSSG
jgi:hypothetical protein